MRESVRICGVHFNIVTTMETLELIESWVNLKGARYHIHTANVDHLVLIKQDKLFHQIINTSDLITCDGMPIVWLSNFYDKKIPERVTGADLTEKILLESNQRGFKVFLLGAKPGVAEKAAKNIKKINPKSNIVGYYSPEKDELIEQSKSKHLVDMINKTQANILLVALGSPKQEKWISEFRPILNPQVTIGVGASFDFIAGEVKRAPKLIRESGFEWLFRLIQEPKRLWKRYIINGSKFLVYVFHDLIWGRKG